MTLNKFSLKNSSILLLKDTSDGIARRLDALNSSNPAAAVIVENLRETISEEFMKVSGGSEITAFTDFLAKSVVLSYYGLLDNDKNLKKLRQRAEESYQKDIEEGKDVSKKLDFMFGFDGLFELVAIAVGFIDNSEVTVDKAEGRSMSNLLSSVRKVGVGEYLSGGYADMDIELVVLLGSRSESELNEFVTSFIKSDDNYNSCYQDTLAQVMATYKYLFQDGFGLRTYAGVVSFSEPYIRVVDDMMRLNTMPSARASFDTIRSKLEPRFDVQEKLDRQFDIKAIIGSGDSKPFYYPFKILEYAMGRELTCELSENVYRNYANNKSWDDYAEGYVEPNMVRYFLDCIYYSLERHFDFGGARGSDTREFFLSREFSKVLDVKGEAAVKAYLSSHEMLEKVKGDISKFKKSLCTAVIAVRYNNLGNKVNAVTVRVVNTTGRLNPNMTKDLFQSFTTNENTKFDAGDVISDGKYVGGDSNKPLPYEIIEYRHDFDSALATAEPLFGYKAVEIFRERGYKLGWDKILLGEDTKGTPVFASRDDIDDFMMQKYTVHNMMAGSRSGKGVMTMNMLASGVASGKPVFYIDRKPDMAVLFHELSGGNMFIVNGGQYEGKNDMNRIFSDSGAAVGGWTGGYDRMPPYLREAFFQSRTYKGNFGDYVYYRAVMFVLGILMARVELAGDAGIYNKLGGDTGVVIIVDEFKNWQVEFESRFFSPDGLFCNQHRITKTMVEGYKKTTGTIRQKTAEMEAASGDPKGAAKIAKYQLDIENAQESLKDIISELDVYCTTLMDKYGGSVKHISSKLSAGFKDSEGLRSDIFVISQHIEIDGFNGASEPSGTYPKRDSGGFNVNNDTKGRSLMRGIFNMFQHDWFMGFNEDGENERHYLGADNQGSAANKWVTRQKYWAYCSSASMETLRHSTPAGTRFFKPYLVLNKHFEDNPENPAVISVTNDKGVSEQIVHPDYAFVTQCRNRVNDAVPGANLWKTVRLKHLKTDAMAEEARTGVNKHYGELNDGIGFQGLASQTKMTNGQGAFNPAEDLGASKVIADYVAQCMGYSGYLEFLFDFSEEGLFSTTDIVKALQRPGSFRSEKAKRLPLFAEYGMLGTGGSDGTAGVPVGESVFSNAGLYDSLRDSESDYGSEMSVSGGNAGSSGGSESDYGSEMPVSGGNAGGTFADQQDRQDYGYAGVSYQRKRISYLELSRISLQVYDRVLDMILQRKNGVNATDKKIKDLCIAIAMTVIEKYLVSCGYEI